MKSIRFSACFLFAGVSTLLHADHPTLSLDEGGPGPLTTISAIPLADGVFAASFQSQFLFNDELSDAQLQQYGLSGNPVHSTGYVSSYSLNTGLGIGDRFMLGFSIPYLTRSDFRETSISLTKRSTSGQSASQAVRDSVSTEENFPSYTPAHPGEFHDRNTASSHSSARPVNAVAQVVSYDIEGLGDATLFGQYLIHKNENSGTYLSLLGGLKLPTGETGERDPFGSLVSTDHQPGTGSWDPLIGLAATKQQGALSFDLNGLYSISTEGARDVTVGNIFNYNAAISYRVLGHESASKHHHEQDTHEHEQVERERSVLDLFIEVNGDYREAADFAGIQDPNTGGNTIFLSGGSRLGLPSGWAAAFSLGSPVLIDLNGIQSQPSLRVLVGISKAF